MTQISILILAAGGASRMGCIKQLLAYKNFTLIETAVNNALSSKANKVYCVLGANSEVIKNHINTEVIFINNPNWEKGISSSIVAGISHLDCISKKPDGVLVTLADQPNVDAQYINGLIDLFRANPNYIIASKYGNKNGVPALFPNLTFKSLLKLKDDKGAQEYMNREETHVITFTSKDTATLDDIDTKEDYSNLLGNE